MRVALLVLVMLSLIPSEGCKAKHHLQPSNLNSHYIRKDGYPTVIVFVHGIFGDAQSTWTNNDTNAYWPNLILEDKDSPAFQKADIYIYAYPSPFFASEYSIDQLIGDMGVDLDLHHVFDHNNVVFIAHSMGGIVVRGYLKRHQQRAKKVSLIYFFSTPTSGAHIVEMAKLLSENPQLGGLLPADKSEYLMSIQRDWRAMAIKVQSTCSYEAFMTKGIRVVDEESASSLCDGEVLPVRADHLGIVKPKDRDDQSYFLFKRAFENRPSPPGEGTLIRAVRAQQSIKAGQTVDILYYPSDATQEGATLTISKVPVLAATPPRTASPTLTPKADTRESRHVVFAKTPPKPANTVIGVKTYRDNNPFTVASQKEEKWTAKKTP